MRSFLRRAQFRVLQLVLHYIHPSHSFWSFSWSSYAVSCVLLRDGMCSRVALLKFLASYDLFTSNGGHVSQV